MECPKRTNCLGTRCQSVRVVLGPNVQGDQLSGGARCHGCTRCRVAVVGYHLNYLDEPVLIAMPKPMLTEFGIH